MGLQGAPHPLKYFLFQNPFLPLPRHSCSAGRRPSWTPKPQCANRGPSKAQATSSGCRWCAPLFAVCLLDYATGASVVRIPERLKQPAQSLCIWDSIQLRKGAGCWATGAPLKTFGRKRSDIRREAEATVRTPAPFQSLSQPAGLRLRRGLTVETGGAFVHRWGSAQVLLRRRGKR